MGSPAEIPITIENKLVGTLRFDEDLVKEACGDEGLEAMRKAGDLVGIAVKAARLDKEIQLLDNVRADFISSFPHELRTPLAVIRDALGMLLDSTLGPVNEKQKKALELSAQNAERLWRLSEELLELSKAALAKSGGRRTLLDIAGLASRVVSNYRPQADGKKVALAADLPAKTLEIWADAEKCIVMLGALVDNAVRYTEAGGRVDVRLEDAGASVRITVADTGAGIDRGHLGLVFDKFYRVTMRAKPGAGKWGTGLVTAKEIADLHCGTISAESEPGKGSVFTVTLPKDLRCCRK